MKRLTTEEVILKFRAVHGDRYDYSEVQYTGTHGKVIIKCSKHGKFSQISVNHSQGMGCPKCKSDNLIKRQTKTTDEFIAEARCVHGDKYSYDCSEYVDGRLSIDIRCPEHGIFTQKPTNHINRKSGCPKCNIENHIRRETLTTDEFLVRARKMHGELYDYSKTRYIHGEKEVEIICPQHGVFLQTPYSHMVGHGCQRCMHFISYPEIEFMDYLQLPIRNYRIPECKRKRVDGYDPKTNTIYEFLGDYWHGNPAKYKWNEWNKQAHMTFGELYETTMSRLNKLKSFGYNVKYIWESDWKLFKREIDKIPKIKSYA